MKKTLKDAKSKAEPVSRKNFRDAASNSEEITDLAAASARGIRLNLAIIIPSLNKYGGAERFVIECVRLWQKRHDISIYATLFDRNLLKKSGITDRVKLIELTPSFEGEHSFVTNAALLPKLWRGEIGNHDVYHTHLWPTHLVDLHPMVWFPHEPLRLLHDLRFEQRSDQQIHVYPKYNYDRIEPDIHQGNLSAVDAVDKTVVPKFTVANSRYTAGYLERVYGRPMPNIVYPGVEIEQPIDLKIDRNLFVTISQLWNHKRVNLLIEATALTDQIQLIIIGSGPEKDRLEKLCVKLGVEDRVFFLSGLSHYDLRLVLARACAFVFCPVREPFGIVVLEAMAAGKPIIAVNEGGYVEACDPDYAMLLAPSPQFFAEAMQQLRDDPEKARRMGEAARKAVQPFTWERAANEIESFLIQAKDEVSSRAAIAETPARSRPLVGIQYYLWYGEGFGEAHWNDNPRSGHVADHPLLGYYASEKGQTIDYHLTQFEAMKLDYVILNLHVDDSGPNQIELRSIRNLFDIAKIRNSPVRFAIQIAPYTSDVEHFLATIAAIKAFWATREEYFQIDGKPVLFWFWSTAHDGDLSLLDALGRATTDFRNLALSLRLPKGVDENKSTFDFFEGFGLYSPLEVSSEENWTRVWQAAYDAAAVARMKYRLSTVSPGYNDRGLTDPVREGNPNRVVPRKGGETYARSLEFSSSLVPKPDLIVIATYNEYHENTHIEPSSINEQKYSDMTREFVELVHSAVPGNLRQ